MVTNSKLVITVDECAKALGISRGTAFSRVNDKSLPAIKLGRRWLIPIAALERMLGEAGKPQSN